MALKYSIEYPDVTDVTHRLEIYDDDYSGAEIEVGGRVFFESAGADDPLEAIKGHGLRVELDAGSTYTFEDLFDEEQRTFPVIYKRNSVVLFNGWINSEGWFEDFVNSSWKVTFDCVDGLSFLEDLAFVDDETGLQFIGTYTQLELLSLALKRTGLQQNINVDIQIYYTGLSAVSILANVNARAVRYVKDDDETIMSCEEVVRDILEPYGACLTTLNGEWYIYKPNQVFDSATLTYYSYDYEGTALNGGSTSTLDIGKTIGSGDTYDLMHCSANQSISKVNSIGAFRVNYKYGNANSLVGNHYFYTDNGTTLQDWTIASGVIASGLLELADAGGAGVLIEARTTTTDTQVLETKIEGLNQDDVLKYNFNLNCTMPVGAETGGVAWDMDWKYQIISSNAAESVFRYLRPGGKVWAEVTDTTVYDITPSFSGGVIQFEQELDPLPQDGKIIIRIFDGQSNTAPATFDIELASFDVRPSVVDDSLEGELHTVQRTDRPARKSEDVKEVATGDTASDLYVGTLYKADANTPTTQWYRTGVSEEKPILQIYGEEVVRLSQKPPMIFSGDVYGYFPSLSRIAINGITGVFLPIKWNYNTQANITSCEFRQLFGDEIDDLLYEKTFDYGNVVRPTIRGTYTRVFPGGPDDTTAPLQGNIDTLTQV